MNWGKYQFIKSCRIQLVTYWSWAFLPQRTQDSGAADSFVSPSILDTPFLKKEKKWSNQYPNYKQNIQSKTERTSEMKNEKITETGLRRVNDDLRRLGFWYSLRAGRRKICSDGEEKEGSLTDSIFRLLVFN